VVTFRVARCSFPRACPAPGVGCGFVPPVWTSPRRHGAADWGAGLAPQGQEAARSGPHAASRRCRLQAAQPAPLFVYSCFGVIHRWGGSGCHGPLVEWQPRRRQRQQRQRRRRRWLDDRLPPLCLPRPAARRRRRRRGRLWKQQYRCQYSRGREQGRRWRWRRREGRPSARERPSPCAAGGR
jgi:hypothetical protein